MTSGSWLDTKQVQVVRYVSECDVVPVLEPVSMRQALADLKEVADQAPDRLAEFDLVDPMTGRYVSWSL